MIPFEERRAQRSENRDLALGFQLAPSRREPTRLRGPGSGEREPGSGRRSPRRGEPGRGEPRRRSEPGGREPARRSEPGSGPDSGPGGESGGSESARRGDPGFG